MTITALLIFMVLSQIALAGYLLYSFNDVEREARKRNADMRAYIDAGFADLERRLTGSGTAARRRAAGEN
jgi:hypothetical protein